MMRRSRCGVAPVIAVLALLAGGIPSGVGVPVVVDAAYGDGIGPSNPIYGIEKAGESIQLALTTDHSAKAMMHLDLASERLHEMEQEVAVGRPEFVEGLLNDYTKNARDAMANAELSGKPNVTQAITDAVSKHGEVLSKVYENAPEQAKFGLETAIRSSNVSRVLEEALARREGRVPVDIPALPPVGEKGQSPPIGEAAEGRGAPIDIPAVGELREDRGEGVGVPREDRIPDKGGEARDGVAAENPPSLSRGEGTSPGSSSGSRERKRETAIKALTQESHPS